MYPPPPFFHILSGYKKSLNNNSCTENVLDEIYIYFEPWHVHEYIIRNLSNNLLSNDLFGIFREVPMGDNVHTDIFATRDYPGWDGSSFGTAWLMIRLLEISISTSLWPEYNPVICDGVIDVHAKQ